MLLVVGCDVIAGPAIALRDPQGVLDEVRGSLRLIALPAEGHACDAASGLLTPDPADAARIDGAVVDLTFDRGGPVTVGVPPGRYAILVRGRGDDATTGRIDVVLATGCAIAEVEDGQTRDVQIAMQRTVVAGVCGDGLLSPDEQCDDGNTATGDTCTDTCRTDPLKVNTTEAGLQTLPSAAWAPDTRAAIVFATDMPAVDLRARFLSTAGTGIETPSAFAVDRPIDSFQGVQTEPSAAIAGGRLAIAFLDTRNTAEANLDIRVTVLDLEGDVVTPSFDVAGAGDGEVAKPRMVSLDDQRLVIVFTKDGTDSGVRGRVVQSGAAVPDGASATVLGSADAPIAFDAQRLRPPIALASLGQSVAMAWESNGRVHFARYDGDLSPLGDATPADPDAAGNQRDPAVTSLGEGRFLVAWTQEAGDDDGSAVRGRIFDAEGTAEAASFVLTSTTAGEQSIPRLGTLGDRVVLGFVSGGELRARIFDRTGTPALNHEPTPTSQDFLVASFAPEQHDVALGGDGMWLATWVQDTDVFVRRFPLP